MQKLYYSISEVSKIVDEEPHILRYWEKEFEEINPKKNRGGNRIYSEKDIANIKMIKSLLRDEKLSLKGAKEQLKNTDFIANNSESNSDNLSASYSAKSKQKPIPEIKLSVKESDLIDLKNLLNEIAEQLK